MSDAGPVVVHLARHAHAEACHLAEKLAEEDARGAARVVHARGSVAARHVDDDALVDYLRVEEPLAAEPGAGVRALALVEQAAAAAAVRRDMDEREPGTSQYPHPLPMEARTPDGRTEPTLVYFDSGW